jgi:ferrous-iron efflux pump FieF
MSIANPYKSGPHTLDTQQLQLRRSAAIASISVAGILIVAKFIAYFMTDSVSIMTSLMDSTFDAVASAAMLISIIHASEPADAEHRFGHGKIEALAALGQALFIFGSAGYLIFESIHRFITPQPIAHQSIGLGIMALSVILTIALITFQKHVIEKTGSVAIGADHLHYKGDLLMNLSVMTALVLSIYSPWPYFDPLFAGGIAIYMLWSTKEIAAESFGILLDQELSPAERERIIALVNTHRHVRAVHDLRTRHTGQQIFIEFHMEVDGDMTLADAHHITEEIEMMIYKEFPKSEVLIHPEPAGLEDYRLDDQIKIQSA